MANMTVATPVDAAMARFNKATVANTFTFHAMRNAEALNLSQSMNASEAAKSAINSATFDNPACGLVPASFINALVEAFNDFMCVDAVEAVCARLTSTGGNIKFN